MLGSARLIDTRRRAPPVPRAATLLDPGDRLITLRGWPRRLPDVTPADPTWLRRYAARRDVPARRGAKRATLTAVRTASVFIERSPDACWREFTNAALLAAWVPGLRRARVVATGDDGLAREVAFEFAASLTYSLVYSYEAAAREVRWEPRVGRRDAVSGRARFEPEDAGTRVYYTADERADGDHDALLAAFQRWMERVRTP